MKVTRLTPHIGAEVTGIDLRKPVDAETRRQLNAAVVEAMNTPAIKDTLGKAGAQVVPNNRATAEYLGTFLKSEIEKWAAPIKASGESVDCCGG